eukprot:3529325-Prymnesium_polylepis.1
MLPGKHGMLPGKHPRNVPRNVPISLSSPEDPSLGSQPWKAHAQSSRVMGATHPYPSTHSHCALNEDPPPMHRGACRCPVV